MIYTIMANIDSNISSSSNKEKSGGAENKASNVPDSQEDEDGGFRDDETQHLPSAKRVTSVIDSGSSRTGTTSGEAVRKRQQNRSTPAASRNSNSHTAATLEHIHSLEHQQEEEQESILNSNF